MITSTLDTNQTRKYFLSWSTDPLVAYAPMVELITIITKNWKVEITKTEGFIKIFDGTKKPKVPMKKKTTA